MMSAVLDGAVFPGTLARPLGTRDCKESGALR